MLLLRNINTHTHPQAKHKSDAVVIYSDKVFVVCGHVVCLFVRNKDGIKKVFNSLVCSLYYKLTVFVRLRHFRVTTFSVSVKI